MKKKSFKKTIVEDELSFEEDFDESGFDVAPLGTQVSSFSFCSDAAEVDKSNNTDFNNNTKDILFTKQANKKSLDNRYGKPTANGAAPPIDGEPFKLKRCHNYRESTIRKLNELKAKHPDVNVYLCTILDEAINVFYNLTFYENKKE